MSSEVDLVDKRQVASELLSGGISPADVSVVLKMPIKDVQQLQMLRTSTATSLTVPDQEIAEAMRNLIWIAYGEAVKLIQFGSPQDRVALIKLVLSGGMRLIGVEQSTRFDEMRTVFETMMTNIRTPEDPEIPFDDGFDSDVEALAAIGDFNDPD